MSKSDDELSSVEAFMEWVEGRHPGESEYHQAVHGVAENVLDLARDDASLRKLRVLQRLTEPDRTISFRVVWDDDDGAVQINRGYRVQHSNAIGPYKGGLRFDPSVNPSVLKFLAFEQAFKNSLTGLNLGAGKGGADFDPRGRSDREVMRFCQAFMSELRRHIGDLTDVPAGDIGVGAREIGYLFGQYRRLENRFSGALTGKAVGAGGSPLREEATGYGAVYFLCAMLSEDGDDVAGKRIAISGAGNVALHAAEKAVALDAKVVSLSNRGGVLRCDDGLSRDAIETIKHAYAGGTALPEIAERVGAQYVEGEKPWNMACDVAIPCATQNELDAGDAGDLADAGCRYVVEGANMPLTEDAAERAVEAGIQLAPGKAANAGGVAVSGFEMSQNRLGRTWSAERLDNELRDVMRTIFDRARGEAEIGGRIDYRRGADRAGFRRVAAAISASGLL